MPYRMPPHDPSEEDNASEDEDDFDDFFRHYLVDGIAPEDDTALEHLLEDVEALDISKKMQNTVEEISLAVVALEMETEANM